MPKELTIISRTRTMSQENKMLFIQLKKEFAEFCHDIYCPLGIIMAMFVYKVFDLRGMPYNYYVHLAICCVAVFQFMFSSTINDLKHKGIVFSLNTKIDFSRYFLVKFIFSVCFGIVCLLCHAQSLQGVSSASILSIPLVFAFMALQVFVVAPLTQGAEIGSSAIVLLVDIALLFVLFLIKTDWLEIPFLAALDISLYFLARKLFYSLYFRKQIR